MSVVAAASSGGDSTAGVVAAVAAVFSAVVALIVWITSETERRSRLRLLERLTEIQSKVEDVDAVDSIRKTIRQTALVVTVRARIPAFFTVTVSLVSAVAAMVLTLTTIVVDNVRHTMSAPEHNGLVVGFTVAYFAAWTLTFVRWWLRTRWYVRQYREASGEYPPDFGSYRSYVLPLDRDAARWAHEQRPAPRSE